jgi:hypothetical protein
VLAAARCPAGCWLVLGKAHLQAPQAGTGTIRGAGGHVPRADAVVNLVVNLISAAWDHACCLLVCCTAEPGHILPKCIVKQVTN